MPLNPGSSGTRASFIERNERRLVLLLCAAAALRVFIYASAFPFFNYVDEPRHFDMVLKYSHLRLPGASTEFSPESFPYLILFDSPEYQMTSADFPGGKVPPPIWPTLTGSDRESFVTAEIPRVAPNKPNPESTGAPLYYLLAGIWLDLGRLLGFKDLSLLYWVRFANIPILVTVVWIGYRTAQLLFPNAPSLRLAVPMLLAFCPQGIYFGIESDNLSPLMFGLVFLGLAHWLKNDQLTPRLGAFIGLAIAATWLVKVSNLPLVIVAALAVAAKCMSLARRGKLRTVEVGLIFLAIGAAVPVCAWSGWCERHFGDFTGSTLKIQILGWARKPIAEWWHHPIFTPAGLWTYWSGLMASFWRGEVRWHLQPLAIPNADLVYAISSAFVLALAVWRVCRIPAALAGWQRQTFWLALAAFGACVAFQALLSIMFDFGDSYYPSRDFPYFISGRLIFGAFIPFALLFVLGLDFAMRPIPDVRTRAGIFCAIALALAVSEGVSNGPVFASQYNLFHEWLRPNEPS